MINNVEAALPQYGISAADVIFEIPVEYDLTRLMALYGDYTQVPDVCSVRSCGIITRSSRSASMPFTCIGAWMRRSPARR